VTTVVAEVLTDQVTLITDHHIT